MKHVLRLFILTAAAAASVAAAAAASLNDRADSRATGQKTSPDAAAGSARRPLANPDHWVGVLGDSGITGAASSPRISANLFTLLDQARAFVVTDAGYRPPGAAPATRIFYGAREYADAAAADRASALLWDQRIAELVDVPEHSFAYRIAVADGVFAADVVVAAQDGKRVEEIPRQLERLFEMDTDTLPPLVFVSFTANDFCDEAIFNEGVPTRAGRFAEHLRRAWAEGAPFLRPHPRGTRFVVAAPLDVTNVLTNPSILAREVPLGAFGTITCGEMRGGEIPYSPLASFTARKLVGMCPAVLGTKPTDVARLTRLREIQSAFNEVWRAQVAKLNHAHARDGLSWTYVEGTREIDVSAPDVGNDCFHPSDRVHAKMADLIWRTLNPPAS